MKSYCIEKLNFLIEINLVKAVSNNFNFFLSECFNSLYKYFYSVIFLKVHKFNYYYNEQEILKKFKFLFTTFNFFMDFLKKQAEHDDLLQIKYNYND